MTFKHFNLKTKQKNLCENLLSRRTFFMMIFFIFTAEWMRNVFLKWSKLNLISRVFIFLSHKSRSMTSSFLFNCLLLIFVNVGKPPHSSNSHLNPPSTSSFIKSQQKQQQHHDDDELSVVNFNFVDRHVEILPKLFMMKGNLLKFEQQMSKFACFPVIWWWCCLIFISKKTARSLKFFFWSLRRISDDVEISLKWSSLESK